MRKLPFKLLFITLISISFTNCKNDDIPKDALIATAYYGNYSGSEMFEIPVYNTGFIEDYEVIQTGANPYPVDHQCDGSILAITRGSSSVTSYDPETGDTKLIPLEHEPRSSDCGSESGLTLVSGKDKSMSSIIENGSVIMTVGENTSIGALSDFGGGLATGHPKWLDANRFFHLDRKNRVIKLYNTSGDELSSLNTPTSVHHLIKTSDDYFYALCEGSPSSSIPPSILKLSINGDILELDDEFSFPEGNVGAENMGGHHLDLSPNDVHIYAGSVEGRLFVIDRNTMELVAEIEVGKGAGHTGFSPTKELAVIINHNDTFVSIVNTSTFQVEREITVANAAPVGNAKAIGHTFTFSPDGTAFYLSAPQDGNIVEIDMGSLSVKSKLALTSDSNPLQGTYVFE